MSRRLLQIVPTLERGGAEKQLTLLARGLPSDLFDVHVCTLTRKGPLENDLAERDVPVTHIEKNWKLDPAAYQRLKRHIERLRPDLVHTWLFAANSYGRVAARGSGVKTLVAGERCIDRWKAWHEWALDRWLARSTARIIVNSEGIRDFCVQHGLPSEKFVVIPGGVPTRPDRERTRREILVELDLKEGTRLIGAVGRLWPQKRVDDLIWAIDLVRILREDVCLLIVGDGPQRSRLKRLVRQAQLEEHVRFLGIRDDVPRLMPHFDLLWQASGYEGLPNSIMEAMAASVPVVATNISGNRDLVVEDETGFLVPLGDRAALARFAVKILNDAELAKRLAAAARQRVQDNFSVEQMVDRHVALYRELLDF